MLTNHLEKPINSIRGCVRSTHILQTIKTNHMKPKPEIYDIKGWQLAAIFLVILFLTQQLEKL